MPERIGEEIQEMLRRGDGELNRCGSAMTERELTAPAVGEGFS